MKFNELYNHIINGWKYTVLLQIKTKSNHKIYPAELCRGLRKGGESEDFRTWLLSLDFEVDKIYGGDGDSGIMIESKPIITL